MDGRAECCCDVRGAADPAGSAPAQDVVYRLFVADFKIPLQIILRHNSILFHFSLIAIGASIHFL